MKFTPITLPKRVRSYLPPRLLALLRKKKLVKSKVEALLKGKEITPTNPMELAGSWEELLPPESSFQEGETVEQARDRLEKELTPKTINADVRVLIDTLDRIHTVLDIYRDDENLPISDALDAYRMSDETKAFIVDILVREKKCNTLLDIHIRGEKELKKTFENQGEQYAYDDLTRALLGQAAKLVLDKMK